MHMPAKGGMAAISGFRVMVAEAGFLDRRRPYGQFRVSEKRICDGVNMLGFCRGERVWFFVLRG
jgi:hypothetical protein